MGNQCGCGDRVDPKRAALEMQSLVKIQAVVRAFRARREKQSIRDKKLSLLFSKAITM